MEDKRLHLQFLQTTIARFAADSFRVKGWSVALITGAIALAAGSSNAQFIYLAYFPSIVFWVLDGFFLYQEKLYREKYDQVRVLPDKDIDFSMTVQSATFRDWCSTILSKTLLMFHGVIFFSIGIVVYFTMWSGSVPAAGQ